jgi:hypothetical protein
METSIVNTNNSLHGNKCKGSQKIVLHACCGPCAIDVVRDIRARGYDAHLYYANSNIGPVDEYIHRRDTIRDWAANEKVDFTEGAYEPQAWHAEVAKVWSLSDVNLAGERPHVERCRACYRQRFEQAAAWAAQSGFDALGTTLTISPYQYHDVIKEELEAACARHGIKSAFEDYSPLYAASRIDAREAGMYMQNYCGCVYSRDEAAAERAAAKAERAAQKAAKRHAEAPAREVREKKLQEAREQKRVYNEKQAKKRAMLKEFKQAQRASSD